MTRQTHTVTTHLPIHYGVDISSYQRGLRMKDLKKQGFSFVIAKCTEGTGYKDPSYQAFRDGAKRANLYFAAYHFLHAGNITGQVSNLVQHIGDRSIPVMIDLEAFGATLQDAHNFRIECQNRGMDVTLLYYPHWYWRSQHSPNLRNNDWHLVQSMYPWQHHEYASVIYHHAGHTGWNSQGGIHPTIWQFTSVCRIAGYSGNVDCNAFSGQLCELNKYFKDWHHAKPRSINIIKSLSYLYRAIRWARAHKKKQRLSRLQNIRDELKPLS